ncbi:hypothetical protein EJ03DRAFT_349574 [Teratosphaeria nubilosa]|uniref:F-box domain-containing protein n=1 Tax=Teratosphaeria nubilosa TaxID=161662 RepID=A0A6G1LG24_9PEZI|nr:hypothetical protein EJ03DRAFT_349574 [Teratosphaeria nubilosa]
MAFEDNQTMTSPILPTKSDTNPASKSSTLLDDTTKSPAPKKQKMNPSQHDPNLNNLTPTTSATTRALALPELLELILRNLDALTLCRLLRTSKSFLTTITTSIHLRRRLWWQTNPTLSAHLARAPTFLNAPALRQSHRPLPNQNLHALADQGRTFARADSLSLREGFEADGGGWRGAGDVAVYAGEAAV